MKTALVFGSSGLTGSYVLNLLEADNRYTKILVFNRKLKGINSPKVNEILFKDLFSIKDLIQGNDVFCCIGTTIAKAGSQQKFKEVDYDFVNDLADIAFTKGISGFSVISSLGADEKSLNFYLRTKGKMEKSLKEIGFENLSIVRPSIILGERKESRIGESIGKSFMNCFSPLFVGFLNKYKPIHAKTIATAMIELLNSKNDKCVFESDELEKIVNGLKTGNKLI